MSFVSDVDACMTASNMPAPGNLYTDVTSGLAALKLMSDAIMKYGGGLTIGELIAAGTLPEIFEVAAMVGLAAYFGALMGCFIRAGVSPNQMAAAGINTSLA